MGGEGEVLTGARRPAAATIAGARHRSKARSSHSPLFGVAWFRDWGVRRDAVTERGAGAIYSLRSEKPGVLGQTPVSEKLDVLAPPDAPPRYLDAFALAHASQPSVALPHSSPAIITARARRHSSPTRLRSSSVTGRTSSPTLLDPLHLRPRLGFAMDPSFGSEYLRIADSVEQVPDAVPRADVPDAGDAVVRAPGAAAAWSMDGDNDS